MDNITVYNQIRFSNSGNDEKNKYSKIALLHPSNFYGVNSTGLHTAVLILPYYSADSL